MTAPRKREKRPSRGSRSTFSKDGTRPGHPETIPRRQETWRRRGEKHSYQCLISRPVSGNAGAGKLETVMPIRPSTSFPPRSALDRVQRKGYSLSPILRRRVDKRARSPTAFRVPRRDRAFDRSLWPSKHRPFTAILEDDFPGTPVRRPKVIFRDRRFGDPHLVEQGQA
jgi:hypothetical protein